MHVCINWAKAAHSWHQGKAWARARVFPDLRDLDEKKQKTNHHYAFVFFPYFSLFSNLFFFRVVCWWTFCHTDPHGHLFEDLMQKMWQVLGDQSRSATNSRRGVGSDGWSIRSKTKGKSERKKKNWVILSFALWLPERKVSNLLLNVFFQANNGCKSWKTKAHHRSQTFNWERLTFFSSTKALPYADHVRPSPWSAAFGLSEAPRRPLYCTVRTVLARAAGSDSLLLFCSVHFILYSTFSSSSCVSAFNQASPWTRYFFFWSYASICCETFQTVLREVGVLGVLRALQKCIYLKNK